MSKRDSWQTKPVAHCRSTSVSMPGELREAIDGVAEAFGDQNFSATTCALIQIGLQAFAGGWVPPVGADGAPWLPTSSMPIAQELLRRAAKSAAATTA